MLYAYPVDLETNPDGTITASFEGLPGATDGRTRQEVLREAQNLLVTALSIYVEDGLAVPVPPAARGRPLVYVPMLEAAKVALHSAMLEHQISNVGLARRLGVPESSVRRLRDLLHESKIGRVEAALNALGRQATVEVLETT
ncbi:MAG: hypothetical protein ABF577_00840 [Acetobacter sp.]